MEQQENVYYHNEIFAYILREETINNINGQHFYGHENDFLQVGAMNLETGRVLKPHLHLPQRKKITRNQEVLIILKGSVEVTFYSDDTQLEFDRRVLKSGDIIVLIQGGHGFKILEETRLIEIKQGPYQGQVKDKFFINN